jgi:hypothetical protein
MAITLNGSTGITNDGGYTGDGVSFADTTPSNTLVTTTGGNVGIGTSSPSGYGTPNLHINGTLPLIHLTDSAVGTASNNGTQIAVDGNDFQITNLQSGNLVFGTSGAERMRIDSSGNLLLGTVTTLANFTIEHGGVESISIRNSTASAGRRRRVTVDGNNTFYVIDENTTGVFLGHGSSSWGGLSDERHKDIVEPISNAAEKVSLLRAVIGKYKTDEEGTRRSFLIAQDVQAVLPEAVDTTNPDAIGLRYTEVIPLLVAAIQEQQAIITEQASAITALEARLTALEQV